MLRTRHRWGRIHEEGMDPLAHIGFVQPLFGPDQGNSGTSFDASRAPTCKWFQDLVPACIKRQCRIYTQIVHRYSRPASNNDHIDLTDLIAK